jgi:hypothetical protein
VTTAHWLFQLCAVVGAAVLGLCFFILLAGLADLLTRPRRRQGFPRSRPRRFH